MLMEKACVCGNFLYSYDSIMLECGNHMADQLDWIFACKQMQGIMISNIRRHRTHFGLGTNETCHGWKQRWLQWGIKHIVIEHVCMESKAYKLCEGWGQPRNAIQLFLQM
jgi:hypothetical protein